MRTRKLSRRFWVEAVVATLCWCLAVVTLFSREWIEAIFGVDPDGGSGAAEWAVVGVLVVIAAIGTYLSRRDWRLAKARAQSVSS